MAVVREPVEGLEPRSPISPTRKNAVVAGVLFIVATAASLLSGPFLDPVSGSGYLTDAAAHHAQVAIGVLLGFTAALAAPGIAAALYPVLRRSGEGLSLGSVAFRTMEGLFYALGMAVLLSLSTLSQDFVDARAPSVRDYRIPGDAMLAQYHWLVDVGLLFAFSIGGFLYYVVFYRSRLIPTWLSLWGIVGVVLLMVAAVLIVVGAIEPLSAGQIALAAPIGVQEMVLAVWLIAKGFNPTVLAGRP